MKDMMCLKPTPCLGEKGLSYLLTCTQLLGDDRIESTEMKIAERILNILRQTGYTGQGRYIATDSGVFYPVTPLPNITNSDVLDIVVSTHIIWVFGAPGLARVAQDGKEDVFIPGVFAGDVEKSGPNVRDLLVGR